MMKELGVRYEYRESDPPLFLRAGWIRIENWDMSGIIVERVTPVDGPPTTTPELGAEPVTENGNASEPLPAPLPLGQLSFAFEL